MVYLWQGKNLLFNTPVLFTNRDIADYYNQTLNHYQKWWKLDRALAVHYGYWDKNTKNFAEALQNTNRVLMETASVQRGERILDAGCGVGGSAFFLANQCNAKVTGITLSEKQLEYANQKREDLRLNNLVDFKLQDFISTSFQNNSFDLVWALESVTSAADKKLFAQETFRLLKPGGRLIIADYFRTRDTWKDNDNLLEKWQNCWGLAEIMPLDSYIRIFQKEGMDIKEKKDITRHIYPSAKMMYRYYMMGMVPSVMYNAFHHTSRFAKNHYKSGKYQYKALKKGLWQYWIVVFRK